MLAAPDPAPAPSAEELFAEYLARRERGEEDPLEELRARAGDQREALERRVAAFGELQELSALVNSTWEEQRSEPVAPQRVGRFQLERLLGRGGLSSVYLARDPDLGREVALKVFAPEVLRDENARAWLLNEARSLARLEHPHIVRVFEIDQRDGQAFLAMELVRGPTLAEVLAHLRGVAQARAAGEPEPEARPDVLACAKVLASTAERCRLAADIARALAYSHAQGVVHRDVKPGNVLLEGRAHPRLIDFGLAHLDEEAGSDSRTDITQRLVGTPAYIAPEQVDRNATGADPKSDQFSLGVVLYELLTLVNPFDQRTRRATLDAISRAAPPRPRSLAPALPEDLERVVLHCLEREPSERYASVADLAADLEAFLKHEAISLQPPSPAKLARLWLRRHGKALARIAAVALVAVTLPLGAWLWNGRADRAAHRARLAELRATLPDLVAPLQFEQRYKELGPLKSQAQMLDTSWLLAGLFGALGPEVEDDLQATSRAVAGRIAAEQAAAAARGIEPMLEPWRLTLGLEAILCRSCNANDALRLHGTIDLPELPPDSLPRLHAMAAPASGSIPVLEPVALVERPPPGAYRLTIWGPGRLPRHELEFLLELDAPRRLLELRPPDAGLVAHMVEVDLAADGVRAGLAGIPQLRDGDLLAAVGSRRVLLARRCVSWGEVRAFVRENPEWTALLRKNEARCAAQLQVEPADARSAVVAPRLAQAFAAWHGLRLPDAYELAGALALDLVERAAAGDGAAAELTGMPHATRTGTRLFIPYRALVAPSSDPGKRTSGLDLSVAEDDPAYSIAADRVRYGAAFRLALSAGPPP